MTPPINQLGRSGITRKIIMLVMISGFLPLLVLATIFFVFAYKSEKQFVYDIQKEMCNRVAVSISAHLNTTFGQIKLFANSLNLSGSRNAEIRAAGYRLLDQVIEFDQITVVDPAGQEISKVSRYYTYRPFELNTVTDQKAFQTARLGRFRIGRVQVPEHSRFPQVPISVPITDARDQLTGVLIVDVNVLKIWDYISGYSVGRDRHAYIVDSEGFLIASQDRSSVLQKQDLRHIHSVHHLLARKSGVWEYDGLAGKRVIGASALIPPSGWGVVVEVPVSDAYQQLTTLTVFFATVFVFTLLLAALLGWRFSFRGIIEPIGLLQKNAQEIARGDFDCQIALHSHDELGQLAVTFNSMATHLKETTVSRDILRKEINEHKKTEAALKRSEEALEKRIIALTLPLADTEPLNFEDLFNLKDIQQIQDEFAHATGVASIITHPNGRPITRPSRFCRLCKDIIRKTDKGRSNCYQSDAAIGRFSSEGPRVQVCMSGGLWDAGAAISVGGQHLANWLIGQVRDEFQSEQKIRQYAREIGADEDDAAEAFYEVPAMSRDRFEQIAKALFTIANQLSTIAYQNVQQARFISDRQRAEAEKEGLEKQMHQAQKLESIGRLAGGVAHDLNNMLSPIIGYGELLMEDLKDDLQKHERLQQIVQAGYRARDLVGHLLAFSRRQTLAYARLNLNQALERFEKLLRRTIREDIELIITPADNIQTINGDVGQIEQVIMNLCVNAQDAMPDGGKLTIETANVELDGSYRTEHPSVQEGRYVMLAVSDTGVGMDADTQSQIFEPFFSTKGEQGTGLGLATVYGIVKQHGGNIWVYSEPGEGTTFKVYLPVAQGLPDEKIVRQKPIRDLKGTETILLAEDNTLVRELAGDILRRQGYHLMVAKNGSEALEMLNAHHGPLDLLLTDVVMPDINGKELFTRLCDQFPDLRVLYMSGYTNDVIAHKGVLDEGIHFIQKPFTVHGLADKVREVLTWNKIEN
ncbi:two component system sensor histidine kinase, hybrid [Desulfosarcina variabilis str. Montpellier]|uniref:PocR ligand-binding domain-containing protein n=1 Tax=Desulfosarcina variabilis TaxID=2300 RepID=UPI003AFA5585